MSAWLAPLCSLCLMAGTPDSHPQSFPYKAYVTSNDVYVRSGPGEDYYPTGQLNAGDVVEVYRHDPGGWYAIRPPEGSFTWVSARYLELGEENLARVTAEGVAARVGSQFSDVRDVIQLRLHKGEVVEILGSKNFGGDQKSGLWYKISPPSGEFRWISGRYVDADYPHGGLMKSDIRANPLVSPPPRASRRGGTTADKPDGAGGGDWQREPIEAASLGPRAEAAGGDRPEPTPAAGVTSAAAWQRVTESVAPRPADPDAGRPSQRDERLQPPQPLRGLSAEEFQAEVEQIRMQLAITLAEEPEVWQLEGLMARAEQLKAQAQTALERGQTRLLLRRLAQAREIKRRQEALQAVEVVAERRHRQLDQLRQGEDGSPEAAAAGRFDGVGRLARVVSPKPGAPRYALVDDDGDIRCFVTPAPGVNMRFYLGKLIGVTGTRGYIAQQRAQHVVAKHITPLESRLR